MKDVIMVKEYLYKYDCEDNLHSLVIEDNGKVAYAYLLKNNKINGDVWLYNRNAPPQEPEWTNPEMMPFANPIDYVWEIEGISYPPESGDDFSVEWKFNEEKKIEYVLIYLNDKKFAKIFPGDKPGYCILAKKDGPLAKVLR